jgi:hypothetical protein
MDTLNSGVLLSIPISECLINNFSVLFNNYTYILMIMKMQLRVVGWLITFEETIRYGHLLLCPQNCLGFDE